MKIQKLANARHTQKSEKQTKLPTN